MSDLFSHEEEERERWPRLFAALGFGAKEHPTAKQINAALKQRGFRRPIDEAATLRDLLTGYPNSWWIAIALEVTGKRDATSAHVVAALSAPPAAGVVRLTSGTITEVRYDAKKKQLRATFRANRRIYLYDDVSAAEYEGLIAAESPGAYFNAHLREKPFREVK
jgi:hypothetical protein